MVAFDSSFWQLYDGWKKQSFFKNKNIILQSHLALSGFVFSKAIRISCSLLMIFFWVKVSKLSLRNSWNSFTIGPKLSLYLFSFLKNSKSDKGINWFPLLLLASAFSNLVSALSWVSYMVSSFSICEYENECKTDIVLSSSCDDCNSIDGTRGSNSVTLCWKEDR